MSTKRHETAELPNKGYALSKQARSLWAKTDSHDKNVWLPLYIHANDAACIMLRLWENWLPKSTRRMFACHCCGNEDLARKMLVFLAAAHDIGKATPIFQAKSYFDRETGERSGLSWKPEKAGLHIDTSLFYEHRPTHPLAGQVLVNRYLEDVFDWSFDQADVWGSVIGAHHGNVPEKSRLHEAYVYKTALGDTNDEIGAAWRSAQHELLEFARCKSELSADDLADLKNYSWDAPAESVVCGLLIMADWIASNQDLFPLIPLVPRINSMNEPMLWDTTTLNERAEQAWCELHLTKSWNEEVPIVSDEWFCKRFALPLDAKPRSMQHTVIEAAIHMEEPGIMVIEAPMGEGKTEAALAAAEILGSRFSCGGVCVALPTMATTDAMFGRVHRWLSSLPTKNPSSIFLAHGKARLNEEYQGIRHSHNKSQKMSSMALDVQGIDVSNECIVVSDWMQGRKKGMLASFVVCTVDQVLMGALNIRHLALRHLALSGKVVIIDECHAYDTYMQQYLKRVLEWLGAWGCPVILLSATLPYGIRDSLIEAYQSGDKTRQNNSAQSSNKLNSSTPIPRKKKSRRKQSNHSDYPDVLNQVSAFDNESYSLITISTGSDIKRLDCPPSLRSTEVDVDLISEDINTLADLLKSKLSDGGIAGVICNTVDRAQSVCRALTECFNEEEVRLVHARFMDCDRMKNENILRSLLGPDSTRENKKRPERLVVVGTQVLEQSLDIDFDLLITDIAPIDLLFQRLGRVHRHARGKDEQDRPPLLRKAHCYIRGIEKIEVEGPSFVENILRVYDAASLIETLSVCGLTDNRATTILALPNDIARMVRLAYSAAVEEKIPLKWFAAYSKASVERKRSNDSKRQRAETYLLPSAGYLVKEGKTLTNLFGYAVEEHDSKHLNEEEGQCAVRDTQETLEVLLVHKKRGHIYLLPWVGDSLNGVSYGSEIPIAYAPDWNLSMVLAQCSVRLPLSLCRQDKIDQLIDVLEKQCGQWIASWQEVSLLAGRLVLALEKSEEKPNVFEATVLGQRLQYSNEEGLSTV